MSNPSQERLVLPPAPAPGCRLCVVVIGDAESAWCEPAIDEVVGPSIVGTPVLASDGMSLVVIGHDDHGVIRVWRGEPGALVERGVIDVDLRLVALVRHDGWWHLYGATTDGRPWHGTSADLSSWAADDRFTAEHPHLVVCGAASMPEGVVILGEVIAHGRRLGWTLLEGSVGPYRAREITFPITADHHVVGPVQVHADEMGLVLSSGETHLMARTVSGTRGRSWTLGLMSPAVSPVVVLTHGQNVWVAGRDPASGATLVAVVDGRTFHLDRADGVVCAGTVHRDQLVLARLSEANECVLTATPQACEDAATAQSRPAYIDSISAA